MRKLNLLLLLIALSFGACNNSNQKNVYKASYGNGDNIINIATGSPGELGLLKELVENYPSVSEVKVNWVKAGSGKSLQLLKDKKVDLVLVHAPSAEANAIKEGWAKERSLIGSNEFIIVGPKNDPAHISNCTSADEAYKKIAEAEANFLSRGDNSGTNKKELYLWKKADVKPVGDWYIITNDFMMATLREANKVSGYYMIDNSTWIAGKKGMDNLKVLLQGDPQLKNIYHSLLSSDVATDSYIYDFAKYISNEKGQEVINNFGVNDFGMPLYFGVTNSIEK